VLTDALESAMGRAPTGGYRRNPSQLAVAAGSFAIGALAEKRYGLVDQVTSGKKRRKNPRKRRRNPGAYDPRLYSYAAPSTSPAAADVPQPPKSGRKSNPRRRNSAAWVHENVATETAKQLGNALKRHRAKPTVKTHSQVARFREILQWEIAHAGRTATTAENAIMRDALDAENAYEQRRRRNPIPAPQLSERDYRVLQMDAYSHPWSPASAKIVRLIKFMDRTKSRKALMRAHTLAVAAARAGAVSHDIYNSIGTTLTLNWKRITGVPYPYTSAREYRMAMEYKARKQKRRRSRR